MAQGSRQYRAAHRNEGSAPEPPPHPHPAWPPMTNEEKQCTTPQHQHKHKHTAVIDTHPLHIRPAMRSPHPSDWRQETPLKCPAHATAMRDRRAAELSPPAPQQCDSLGREVDVVDVRVLKARQPRRGEELPEASRALVKDAGEALQREGDLDFLVLRVEVVDDGPPTTVAKLVADSLQSSPATETTEKATSTRTPCTTRSGSMRCRSTTGAWEAVVGVVAAGGVVEAGGKEL